MLMSVEELKMYLSTSDSDEAIKAKLCAMEALIRSYTNNRFYANPRKAVAGVVNNGEITSNEDVHFAAGDTIQATLGKCAKDGGIYTIKTVNEKKFTVEEEISDMAAHFIKVSYDMNIKMGVVNLMKWEIASRNKVGIASETISRHSITYLNMDGDNSLMGYPRSLLGFLKPYRRARI